jgi:hypothetical protein
MSNYFRETKHPETGYWEKAEWLDDFYGSHHYGVRFPNGAVYDPEKIEMETRDTPEKPPRLRVAFDVDDTIILPAVATDLDRDVPNYETIAVYRWFQAQGCYMIVWSGGGQDYARMWGEKLGLCPDEYRAKAPDGDVDLAFDDCDVSLGKVNVKVLRLKNGIKRPKPNA